MSEKTIQKNVYTVANSVTLMCQNLAHEDKVWVLYEIANRMGIVIIQSYSASDFENPPDWNATAIQDIICRRDIAPHKKCEEAINDALAILKKQNEESDAEDK